MKKTIFSIIIVLLLFTSCNSKNTNKSDFLKGAINNGLFVGSAVNPDLLSDKNYKNTLLQNFNFITAENVMKWEIIHPTKDTYDFKASDKLVDFATENGMLIRGHTLIWHFQNPKWLEDGNFNKEELLNILEDHIKTVVGRYKGKIKVWDVVNEAIDGSDYRETIWYKTIGPEYIEMAFKWAHEADPDAELIYNDYGIGQINQKSDKVYDLVLNLQKKNIPITGIGFQLHIDMNNSYDFESLYNNVIRFEKIGLHVDFTEIDIRFSGDPDESKLEKQARYYKKLAEIMLNSKDSHYFTVWGVTDAHSWIPGFFTGFDHALLFDKEYNAKPAIYSITDVFDQGPKELGYVKLGDVTSRKIIPSFKAIKAVEIPLIDGNPSDSVWDSGVTYPFAYNQLAELNLTVSDSYQDIFAEWVILYSGNTVYGRVKRVDDVTTVDSANSWDNDNVEVFFSLNKQWAQLRSVVGRDFEPHKYSGNQKAIWNEDNSVLEFSFEMPVDNLNGQLSGWNIAISDNDGKEFRDVQLYAINGINKGYEGKGFGNIQFIGNSPMPPEKPNVIKPFIVNKAKSNIELDGKLDDSNWANSFYYSLKYNQYKSYNQLPNNNYSDISGNFSLVSKDGSIFGAVEITDDKVVNTNNELENNDHLLIAIEFNKTVHLLSVIPGKDFVVKDNTIEARSIWNSDFSVLEFEIVTGIIEDIFVGFNIALVDVDDKNIEYKLYPITGNDKISLGSELGELQIIK